MQITRNKRLLELTSDVVFKNFFMSENTIEYTAEFINLITGIPKEEIMNNAIFENIELPIIHKNSKQYKCDIIISIASKIINLEMNSSYYEGIIEKNNNYLFRILGDRFHKGDNYFNSKKVIQINIDDFQKYTGDKLIYKFQIKEEETLELETENYESYHICLPYLKKKCYNEKKLNRLEKMCKIFLLDNIEEAYQLTGDDKIMERAIQTLEELSQDDSIIGLYDAEKVEQKILNTKLLYYQKLGMEEGLKEGIEQGIEQGLEKGIEQGIEQGIELGRKQEQRYQQVKIAKNLKEKNIPLDIISVTTELDISEIEKL